MVNASYTRLFTQSGNCAGMMNKSLRDGFSESSSNAVYGFHGVGRAPLIPLAPRAKVNAKKEPPFPAALKLITGRRQTEWTGATRCPNEDGSGCKLESLINRKWRKFFKLR